MNIFYEESGAFKVGTILTDNNTSLQIEAVHGKRSKIKSSAVLLRFTAPPLSEFMNHVQKIVDELDPNFLWEFCSQDTEFTSDSLATEYFGHTPTPVESAATLLLLQNAPKYFYKKGLGRYKAAPPEALKAALASEEKKRLQAERQARYIEQLNHFALPEEFKSHLSNLLYKPDKNSVEWKAVDYVCAEKKLTVAKLMEKCGAIPSSHDYHFNQFVWENFPQGIDFKDIESQSITFDFCGLPIADVEAFSIDDASTTEIDDAFSVTPLPLGSFRIGIHIAAPALGISPESVLDEIAATRLSTVYLPGNKITMLPNTAIEHFTLVENQLRPALSLYLEVSDDFIVTKSESKIECIKIGANLRHNRLEQHFNETTLNKESFEYPFGRELGWLWKFACKMENLRGKANDTNNDKIDYSFEIANDHVTINERRRGSPIDKVVSELMIYVNTEWGRQLTAAGITGIFRSQANGKVKMSTSPAPHQGLGVSQYTWSSSPMRRYVDLINQRQIVAWLRGEPPPYSKESNKLLIAMRDFEAAYGIYTTFQRAMERYWCLRWLLQENIQISEGQIIKENLVKLDRIPLVIRVPSLPEIAPGNYVQLKLSEIDLLECSLHAEYLHKLDR
ncbi:MAG: RNB domain-containing ribonuclease [Nitrosomonas sp. PRO4]|nr:RNB domain-containing ribonuclease [Nitrosomonas sp. PRO4]